MATLPSIPYIIFSNFKTSPLFKSERKIKNNLIIKLSCFVFYHKPSFHGKIKKTELNLPFLIVI
ncbi:hypothetical protein B1H62_01795 [Streptococcus agalactiae]|nr:hypothetical protein B1H62_01795 [Streptococcus agalactiae]